MRARRDLWKGCLAGVAGGLVASLVMSEIHSVSRNFLPAVGPKGEDSTVKTASAISEAVFHHELTDEEKKLAGPAVHYTFGALMGALFGVSAELTGVVRAGWGTIFGIAVWLGAHVITVPLLRLSKPVTASEPRMEAVEFGTHVLYGAVLETVRRWLRRTLIS
jgi:putative membrane protein